MNTAAFRSAAGGPCQSRLQDVPLPIVVHAVAMQDVVEGGGSPMTERRNEREQRFRRKELVKGILGGCSVILFAAAIIAGAVLWRASWYAE